MSQGNSRTPGCNSSVTPLTSQVLLGCKSSMLDYYTASVHRSHKLTKLCGTGITIHVANDGTT